jgi:hypothetical protein
MRLFHCGKGSLWQSKVIVVACLLAALPISAQYPGQVSKTSKDAPEPRSIAILEWTGETGNPKASRLVPVAVLDQGQLQDGAIYLARPQPLALAGEVEYELQQNGLPIGLFDIKNSGLEQGSWVGYGAWKPLAKVQSKPSKEELARIRIEDDESESDLPILHRKHHADEDAAGANKDSASPTSASPSPDPDRPTPHKKSNGLDVLPSLMGMPADMQQAVAVSDSQTRPEHSWSFSWANPEDEAAMKASLEETARDLLGLNPPLAPAPAKAASRRKFKPETLPEPPTPPLPAQLMDENFRVFELAYNSGATLVLTARTDAPLTEQKFVTLIAQPDLYGNVKVLLEVVASGAHLDETPRMRLVGAVDALADNRGELLFELRGATQRQFVLYRILRGQAEKLFVSAAEEFACSEVSDRPLS